MRHVFGLMSRVLAPALVLVFLGGSQVACNKDKDKDKSGDDDKSSKKKKKKGDDEKDKKSSDDDDDDDDDEPTKPKGVEVPNAKGFLVPPGGTYKHNSFEIGENKLEMDSYEYPLDKFPRAALRKSLAELCKSEGWKPKQDITTATSVDAVKKGMMVTVLIGENKPESTMLNVMPPIPDTAGGGGGDGDSKGEDFTGSYNSNFGAATITQSGNKVTIKYALGTANCTATGKKLNCHWIEATSSGDAVMTKQPDGKLVGTWGSGQSSTNGGGWTFTPKKT